MQDHDTKVGEIIGGLTSRYANQTLVIESHCGRDGSSWIFYTVRLIDSEGDSISTSAVDLLEALTILERYLDHTSG